MFWKFLFSRILVGIVQICERDFFFQRERDMRMGGGGAMNMGGKQEHQIISTIREQCFG